MIVFFAYLFFFAAASASPLQRRWLAKKHEGGGQIAFAFWVVLIVAILGFILFLFFPPELHGEPLQLALLALACGVFGATFFVTQYTAQKHVDAGVTSLLSNVYTPITIVLATVFLNEGLRPMQIVGTVLLLISIVLVSKKHHLGKFKFDKYFWMMIASGAALGIVLTAERSLMLVTGFSTGTLMSWWSQCIGLGIAMLVTKSKNTHSKKDTGITGILRFLQSFSYVLLIYLVGNLSVVSAVTTFKVVVIFIAAAIFLHEREDLPRKIVGSVIAVVGLLLMK